MNKEYLRDLLYRIQTGKTGLDEAMQQMKAFPFEDLGYAKIDSHRDLRTGVPEVIFCPGKNT